MLGVDFNFLISIFIKYSIVENVLMKYEFRNKINKSCG